jgi:hypothetical protein
MYCEVADQIIPRVSVDPERIGPARDTTRDCHYASVIERMRQRNRRVNPFQAMLGER